MGLFKFASRKAVADGDRFLDSLPALPNELIDWEFAVAYQGAIEAADEFFGATPEVFLVAHLSDKERFKAAKVGATFNRAKHSQTAPGYLSKKILGMFFNTVSAQLDTAGRERVIERYMGSMLQSAQNIKTLLDMDASVDEIPFYQIYKTSDVLAKIDRMLDS